MDKNKNVTDDQTALEDMPQTGGDVVAREDQEISGQIGGRAAQQQQEQQESQEFDKQNQSEDKENKPSESEDLWGQE